ncbi:hypothetical protein EJ05DRAFT_335307 [Pseudovirgaria hyperparasitica]|uniref:Uncharacterized protein n=1 Tax=Pseudovirgaria hyperparasitica TaxID=470096 RepID=A0A6A6WB31_9PEZI|nr:uncharacterized protein EJ05DRAFT_335307 [Pseudovirgaria hyperparasitica]KAF2759170.1 hypothetical protein EJ05DRAFT_335307 [Pseudovirgaria hyperparasitica]
MVCAASLTVADSPSGPFFSLLFLSVAKTPPQLYCSLPAARCPIPSALSPSPSPPPNKHRRNLAICCPVLADLLTADRFPAPSYSSQTPPPPSSSSLSPPHHYPLPLPGLLFYCSLVPCHLLSASTLFPSAFYLLAVYHRTTSSTPCSIPASWFCLRNSTAVQHPSPLHLPTNILLHLSSTFIANRHPYSSPSSNLSLFLSPSQSRISLFIRNHRHKDPTLRLTIRLIQFLSNTRVPIRFRVSLTNLLQRFPIIHRIQVHIAQGADQVVTHHPQIHQS